MAEISAGERCMVWRIVGRAKGDYLMELGLIVDVEVGLDSGCGRAFLRIQRQDQDWVERCAGECWMGNSGGTARRKTAPELRPELRPERTLATPISSSTAEAAPINTSTQYVRLRDSRDDQQNRYSS